MSSECWPVGWLRRFYVDRIGIRFLREGTRGVEQREDYYAGHGGRLICELCVVHGSGELTAGPFAHVSCGEVGEGRRFDDRVEGWLSLRKG